MSGARTGVGSRAGLWAGQLAGGLVLAFLLLPIFAVLPASLNDASFIKIPPAEWSTRWYAVFAADPGWVSSVLNSLQVALLATVIAVTAGTAAALGLDRLAPRSKRLAAALVLAPIIVPTIMLAIALYYVTRRIGLYGTVPGLALGHAVLCLPFVVLNMQVSLSRLDPALLRAAEGLGASPWRVFRTVTLPAILPGLAGGGAFAFVTSFDEVILSLFLAGATAKTLPIKLWEQIRVEFTPAAAVGSTLILALTLLLFLAVQATRRATGARERDR